jgi:hydrogenase-1 operon protein HyaF
MSTSNPFGIGPGSQPEEDDAVLDYMALPQGMTTWQAPILPEPGDMKGMEQGLAALDQVLEALRHFKVDQPAYQVDVSHLDERSRSFIDDVLGEGEVSIIAGSALQAQESVLAGVWRVRTAAEPGKPASDVIEVGHVPSRVHDIAFAAARRGVNPPDGVLPEGLLAAPSLLAELQNVVTSAPGDDAEYAINLSLLPHSEEDLAFLDQHLGQGEVHILSRGYGNCRISATATRNIWWVRYYNSQDTLILNSLEVARIPEVAFAAIEDIHDSERRLAEILGVYR